MAELVGLLASIAGATTAGIQISKILYSAVRTVRDLEEEVSSVAREVTVLSSAFDEISNAIQAGNEDGLRVSSAAILTIADLVKDSQDVYSKIRRTVDNQPSIASQARWIFRRQDVAVWSAKVSKNISLLNLMMTTLLWARTRRAQATMAETQTLSSTEPAPAQSTSSRPSLELPSRIQEQVVQTVLCVENLDKLEEDNSDGALRVDFTTGPDLEPRHYVYEPQVGALRRILPDSASLWLSEVVNVDDGHTLSGRTIETLQEDNNDGEPDKDELAHATELADRLAQDWTNLTINEDTMAWEAVSDDALLGADEARNLELLSLGNTSSPGPSDEHPRILLSTFEFTIDEDKITVRASPIGIFSKALSRSMGISEVTWVIPRLQDVHYPVDATKTKCLTVQVDGMEIKANALSLRRGPIHYIIIDCEGMMGELSKGRPYPNDMETETTAKFSSFWNQCVAMVIRATSPDIYLMIDSRSALAPYYLDYPICCCVALVELRHQGKWMLLNTAEDMEKWRKIFNLERQVFSPIYNEMCTSSYLDWRSLTTGSASHMNFLHAAAQYMHRHQNGYGNYIVHPPLDLWNPRVAVRGHKDDTMTRAQRRLRTSTSQFIATGGPSGHHRPNLRQRAGRKRKAQEWAGFENNSDASLFFWVGRIMVENGAEYLPDVIEGLLLKRTSVQCIVAGPVWDALGEAAAYDLLRLQSHFPGRLCVKLQSANKVVPTYVWDSADFAFNLIMIKPWNFYTYELACKGAVVVGFRPNGFPRRSGFFFADSGILTLRQWTRSQIIRDCIRVSIEAADSTEATRNELRDAAYPVEDGGNMIARTVQEVLDLCNTTYRQAISPQGFPEASEQVQKVEREIQELIELGPRLG